MLISKSLTTLVFCFAIMSLSSCAHEPVADAPLVVAPTPTSAPLQKARIKYVYVETPATESGMTTAPFERLTDEPTNVAKDVVRILWPLLTMLGAGLVLIIGLFVEHHVLKQQLARRAEMKSQLHA